MINNRYAFIDNYYSQIKIYTNRLYKQYIQKKNDLKKIQDEYKIFLNNYATLTGLKWQTPEIKTQIKNYDKERVDLEIELNKTQQELNIYEKEYLFYYNKENSSTFPGYQSKGFLDRNFINKFLDGTQSNAFILQGMQYRPDKVSMFYYQTPYLFWVISLVNNFFDMSDYTEGREIILPSSRTINNILN